MTWKIVAGIAVGFMIAAAFGFLVFYEFTNAIVSSVFDATGSVLGITHK